MSRTVPQDASPAADGGATVVITHRVRPDQHDGYGRWLQEISPLCQAWPGYLDTHIVRPIPGLTDTYAIIIRFDTESHLRQWMGSPARQRLIAQAQPLLAADDAFEIRSGLDFLFPAPAGAKPPVRWKQALLTWSAIFPLVLVVSALVRTGFAALGVPAGAVLSTLVATAIVVSLMVYVVMPRYTRLVQRWLFA